MSGEGFLDRWSRRKRAATDQASRAAQEPDIAAAREGPESGPEDAPGAEPPCTLPQPPEAEVEITEVELAALTPVEQIDAETDLRQYLRKGVPRALRNAALRRKWLLNAVIRDHRDIAVDYAWDWNVPGGVPGDGGPLDREMVARMAERLFTPAQPPEEGAEGPADLPPVAATPQAAPPERAPADEDKPLTAQASGGAENRVAAEAPATPAEDATPQRRHGGAAPV